MNFNLDVFIVIAFLAANLFVGLYYSGGIKNIKEYAVGNRDFSTSTITATIVATWIGGGFFVVHTSQLYKDGLAFFIAAMANICTFLIIGYIFAPRMKGFLGDLSVAGTMGRLYGKNMKYITALASIFHAVGMIAVQIKVFSSLFDHFLGISGIYGVLAGAFIVILYSSFGGIRSVTFTDVVQFVTFGVFIPIFALFLWHAFGKPEAIVHTLKTNQIFDLKIVSDYKNPAFWPFVFIVLYQLFPNINSTMYQRILMAKNVAQIKTSFTASAVICFVIALFCCLIGLVALSVKPGLNPNNLLFYIIDLYSAPGIKGAAVIGIAAMVMSTVDSWINTGAVIFYDDICKPLGIGAKSELLIARLFAVVLGIGAVSMAFYSNTVFDLILLKSNFYRPVVTVPLLLAIFGFRSSFRAVFIAIISGMATVILWKTYVQPVTGVDSVLPGMFANFVALLSAHYILREPGGWERLEKSESEIKEEKRTKKKREEAWKNFKAEVYSFGLGYFKKFAPKKEIGYVFFAGGIFVTAAFAFYLEKEIYTEYTTSFNLVGLGSFAVATFFACQGLLPSAFREKYLGIIWYFSIFVCLAFIGSFVVILSNFSGTYIGMYLLNLGVIAFLLNWRHALGMGLAGPLLSLFFYYWSVAGEKDSAIYLSAAQSFYVSFVALGLVYLFFKPRNEEYELANEKAEHIDSLLKLSREEMIRAKNLKEEFLRNIEHELHAPMTGITSMADTLLHAYDKLTPKQIREGLETVYKSSARLDSFAGNLINLSKFLASKLDLKPEKIDLGELIENRLETCGRLYGKLPEQELVLDIGEGIIIEGDKNYLSRALDNLILNALSYCLKGKITVSLKKKKDSSVEFLIEDEGIGVPPEEIEDIFGYFSVSSKTRTPAGGRGLGLSLVKMVADVHGARVLAESNGKKGARFGMVFI